MSNKEIQIKTKNKFTVFVEMMGLIFKSFYRDKRGPLFMYIVPVFFLILFFYIPITGDGPDSHSAQVSLLFSYIILPCMTMITSLSPAIVSWKNSVFLRRIDGSGIKKSLFLVALWVSYLLISYTGVTTQVITSIIVGRQDFINNAKEWNWLYFFVGINLVSITCIGIATLIGGIGRSEGAIQGIVMMVYFLSIFLSGLMIPTSVVEASKVMTIVVLFIPLKYAIYVFSYTNHSVAGYDSVFLSNKDGVLNFPHIWIPILAGVGIIIALFVAILFTFRWTTKS